MSHIHIHTHLYTHTLIHTHTHTYTHTHTHTHTLIPQDAARSFAIERTLNETYQHVANATALSITSIYQFEVAKVENGCKDLLNPALVVGAEANGLHTVRRTEGRVK